jgi:hypothetical protein
MKSRLISLMFVLLVTCSFAQTPPNICDCISAPITDRATNTKCDAKYGFHNLIERESLAQKATNCLEEVRKERVKQILNPKTKLTVCECIYWESKNDDIRKKCERQLNLVYMSDAERKAYNAKRKACINSREMSRVINKNKLFLDSLIYKKILHTYYYPEISVRGGNGSKSTLSGYLQARTNLRGLATIPVDVAVMERGKKVKSTRTDANGHYTIDLPHGKALTIVFSSKGYVTQKLDIAPISGATAISTNLNLLTVVKTINTSIFDKAVCKIIMLGKRMGTDDTYHKATRPAFNKVYTQYEKQLEPGS